MQTGQTINFRAELFIYYKASAEAFSGARSAPANRGRPTIDSIMICVWFRGIVTGVQIGGLCEENGAAGRQEAWCSDSLISGFGTPKTSARVCGAMAGYFDELIQARSMLDNRYDEIKSGRVKLIPNEVIARLRAKSASRRSQSSWPGRGR